MVAVFFTAWLLINAFFTQPALLVAVSVIHRCIENKSSLIGCREIMCRFNRGRNKGIKKPHLRIDEANVLRRPFN